MRNFVWVIAWLCVAVWTAVAAVGYWLINALTGFAANNADKVGGDAETVELINWLALLLQSIGDVAAVILWAVISLAILGIAWADHQADRKYAPGPATPQKLNGSYRCRPTRL